MSHIRNQIFFPQKLNSILQCKFPSCLQDALATSPNQKPQGHHSWHFSNRRESKQKICSNSKCILTIANYMPITETFRKKGGKGSNHLCLCVHNEPEVMSLQLQEQNSQLCFSAAVSKTNLKKSRRTDGVLYFYYVHL